MRTQSTDNATNAVGSPVALVFIFASRQPHIVKYFLVRGEFPARSGNKRLKNALFYSAFAAIRSHEPSRQYYERKRAEGKRHNAAVICLARRRCNVIYAILKNKEFFREIPPRPAAA
ncbi:Hypothetical protein Cp106_1429 [Corynebacterium pseudotuberculosis 1/06-A]|nr:Hypothetical protein Cp106_1429 [Corynebacterium pseudotuberculosis 1/06-A]